MIRELIFIGITSCFMDVEKMKHQMQHQQKRPVVKGKSDGNFFQLNLKIQLEKSEHAFE